MSDEPVAVQLARIEERLKNIEEKLDLRAQCRHVTREGDCDFFNTIIAHDRQLSEWGPSVKKIDSHETSINQWTGAMSLASAISAAVGALLAIIVTKVWK